MKFKVVISPDKLKPLLAALELIASEARWNVSDSGIYVKAVDPANVMLTAITIPAEACDFLMSDKGELGLDVSTLKDMISDTSASDPISLELLEEQIALKISAGRLTWNLSLIAPDSINKEPRIPELDLPCLAEIESAEFNKIIKAAKKITDHIRITMEDDKILFLAKEMQQKVEASIPVTELHGAKLGYGSALFSLDYLEDIAKPATKSEYIKLEFGTDYPLRASFLVNGGSGPGVSFEYLVAPRVESD